MCNDGSASGRVLTPLLVLSSRTPFLATSFFYILSVSPFLSTLATRGCFRAFGSSTIKDPFHSVNRFRFSLQSPHIHMVLVRHTLGCKTLPSPIRRQLVNSSHHRLLLHSEHNITITKLSHLHPSPSRVPLLCPSCALTMNHMHVTRVTPKQVHFVIDNGTQTWQVSWTGDAFLDSLFL